LEHAEKHVFLVLQHASTTKFFSFCTLARSSRSRPRQKNRGGVPPHPPRQNRLVATSNFGPRALSIVWFGDILLKVHMGSIKNPYTLGPGRASWGSGPIIMQ
jgi:hypothetical protein